MSEYHVLMLSCHVYPVPCADSAGDAVRSCETMGDCIDFVDWFPPLTNTRRTGISECRHCRTSLTNTCHTYTICTSYSGALRLTEAWHRYTKNYTIPNTGSRYRCAVYYEPLFSPPCTWYHNALWDACIKAETMTSTSHRTRYCNPIIPKCLMKRRAPEHQYTPRGSPLLFFSFLFFFFCSQRTCVRQESNSRLTFVTVYRLPI